MQRLAQPIFQDDLAIVGAFSSRLAWREVGAVSRRLRGEILRRERNANWLKEAA